MLEFVLRCEYYPLFPTKVRAIKTRDGTDHRVITSANAIYFSPAPARLLYQAVLMPGHPLCNLTFFIIIIVWGPERMR